MLNGFPRLSTEIHYANWRSGKQEGEVDIVGLNIAKQKPCWAVEVKWSDRYYDRPTELTSIEIFHGQKQHGLRNGYKHDTTWREGIWRT